MVWSHPDISLEDLLNLIKGFVDILILASGYQTSGHLAHWDAQNIKNVFQWGLFFEDVFKRLSCLEDYQDSAKELDAALSEMTSNPCFPQGIAHLSSVTLSRASDFVLEYLIHALPLREAHLRAFMMATIEMDLDKLQRTENNCLHVYLKKLMLQNTSSNEVFDRKGFVEDSTISSPDTFPNQKTESYGDFTTSAIQKLMRRQLTVSCISSVGMALDSLSKIIGQSNWTESDNSSFRELLQHATAPLIDEQSVEYVTWNHWRTRNLSYFLDKRTIRLVSGANMIFSAPKIQWIQVFEQLNIYAKTNDDDLLETIELLLLGCIASRWSSLIEHFMTVSYDSLSTSKQYHEVRNLLHGRFQNLHSKEEMINSKEKDILEQLAVLLSSQPQQLWKLSPALAAVAIPSWSHLFKSYLSDLDSQFKGDSSAIRYYFYLVVSVAVYEIRRSIRTVSLLRGSGASISFMFVVPIYYMMQALLEQFLVKMSKELTMKFLNMESLKKIQILKWWRRIACNGSAVSLLSVGRKMPVKCFHGSHVLRRLLWRFKSQWKQALIWQRNTAKYSYDPRSYSQNFDDHCFNDHLSPLAPR